MVVDELHSSRVEWLILYEILTTARDLIYFTTCEMEVRETVESTREYKQLSRGS